jgi:hypothetical protein
MARDGQLHLNLDVQRRSVRFFSVADVLSIALIQSRCSREWNVVLDLLVDLCVISGWIGCPRGLGSRVLIKTIVVNRRDVRANCSKISRFIWLSSWSKVPLEFVP